MKKISLFFLVLTSFTLGYAQPDKMEWWKEAKFGLFIHWGLYSIPAGYWNGKPVPGIGEWIMNKGKIPMADYKQLPAQFNPVKFDAEEWVKLAKNAGMKYIVITSKHHDGFAMFKSYVSNFNIVDATPFKRDVVKELAEACKKNNIKFGIYYSQAQDWNHPGGAAIGGHWDSAQAGNMDKYLDEIAVPQVKEILTAYHPAVIWWDTPIEMTKERTAKFIPLLEQYPDLIYNNRLGPGTPGDLETPEQYIPATGFPGRNWESCMTMNNTWGYKSDDNHWKSTTVLIRNLIDIASKGGNYLLNVGPTAEGLIPSASIERLQQIGEWLHVNGEAIYGVHASPFAYLSWGRATQKNNKLYLHVFNWPSNHILKVPLKNDIIQVRLLSNNKPLQFEKKEGYTYICLPVTPPDTVASVISLEVKGIPESSITEPIPSLHKSAVASSQESNETQASNVLDGKSNTVWKTAKGETTGWLEINLGKQYTIGEVVISEAGRAVQSFQLLYKDGEQWKELSSGKTIGNGFVKTFKPVLAQYFKLNITKSISEPQIKEVQLFFED